MILPGWNELSQEEILENIRHAISLMNKHSDYGLINPHARDEMEYYESEAFKRFANGRLPQIPDTATIDRLFKEACQMPPAPVIMPREEFERSGMRIGQGNKVAFVKDIWPEMKVTLTRTLDVFRDEYLSQYTLEELQKAVQKHPNRIDLKLELMKLQKQNKTKYIGRPKRKKKK